MYCHKCGTEIPAGANFCPACGTELESPSLELVMQTEIEADSAAEVVNELEDDRTEQGLQDEEWMHRDRESRLYCSAIHSKQARLFGEDVLFHSKYFIEGYTYDYYKGRFGALGESLEDKLRQLGPNAKYMSKHIYLETVSTGDEGRELIAGFVQKIGLDHETAQEIYDTYGAVMDEFSERISELGELFEQIDLGVDEVVLQGEARKADRPMVHSFGMGIGGLARAAVTQSVFNAGSGLIYDMINGINRSGVQKKATERKKELLEGCIQIVRNFFNEGDQVIPKMCLQAMGEHHPYSIWARDTDRLRELEADYKRAKSDETRQEIAVQLLRENPWDLKNYGRVLGLIQSEAVQKRGKDYRELFKISGWFGQDTAEYKQKYVTAATEAIGKKYEVSDMTRYDQMIELECTVDAIAQDVHDRMCEEYLSELVGGITDCTPETINSVVEQVRVFGSRYSCDPSNAEEQIVRKILIANGAVTDEKQSGAPEIETLRANIETAQRLQEKYVISFDAWINEEQKKLDDIVKTITHVEEIVSYKIKTKEFIASERVLDGPEQAPDFHETTKKIQTLCGQLDIGTLVEQREEIIRSIRTLCINSGYSTELADDLIGQYTQADLEERTVGDIVYNTPDEANKAREELAAIDRLYQQQDSRDEIGQIVSFSALMQMDFQTASGKNEVVRREQQLMQEYFRTSKSVSGTVVGGGAKVVVFFCWPWPEPLLGRCLCFGPAGCLKSLALASELPDGKSLLRQLRIAMILSNTPVRTKMALHASERPLIGTF